MSSTNYKRSIQIASISRPYLLIFIAIFFLGIFHSSAVYADRSFLGVNGTYEESQQALVRRDDLRLSAFLRLWMYYLNDGQYIDSAREVIEHAAEIANNSEYRRLCASSSNIECLKAVGCRIKPPFKPICPPIFSFHKGSYQNIFLDGLDSPIVTYTREFTGRTLAFLVQPDDIVYYGMPGTDDPRTAYLVSTDLLQQYWMANPAVREAKFKLYVETHPDRLTLQRRFTFSEFLRNQARESVESYYKIKLRYESSDYTQRINNYLSQQDDPFHINSESISSLRFNRHSSASRPGEFQIFDRFLDFKLEGLKTPLPFSFDCQGQLINDLVYHIPDCQMKSLDLNVQIGLHSDAKQSPLKTRSEELAGHLVASFRDRQESVGEILFDLGSFIGPQALLLKTTRIAAYLKFLGPLPGARWTVGPLEKAFQFLGTQEKTAKLADQLFAIVDQKPLVSKTTGWFLKQQGYVIGLTAGIQAIVRFFGYHPQILDPIGTAKIQAAQSLVDSTEEYVRALEVGDRDLIESQRRKLNRLTLLFMSEAMHDGRKVGIRVYPALDPHF